MQVLKPDGALFQRWVDLHGDSPIIEIVIASRLVTIDLASFSAEGFRLRRMELDSEAYNLVVVCGEEDADGKTLVTASLDPIAVTHTTTC